MVGRAAAETEPLVAARLIRILGLLFLAAEAHLRHRAYDAEGDPLGTLFRELTQHLTVGSQFNEPDYGEEEKDDDPTLDADEDAAYLIAETQAKKVAAEKKLSLSHEADEAIAEMQHMAGVSRTVAAGGTTVPRTNSSPKLESIGEVTAPYSPAELSLNLKGQVSMSMKDSYGFFSDSGEDWERRKAVHIAQLEVEAASASRDKDQMTGSQWWQLHYEPSFHCSFAERLGNAGEGGKWVCDPYRIADATRHGEPCLVYSVGSRGEFSFEEAVQKRISSSCEVHVFDPLPPTNYTKGREVPSTMTYHMWPLGADGLDVKGVPAKSLSSITKDLGHIGRRIDILKIDCEGCEWNAYTDWLDAGVDIRQILVELHAKSLPDRNWHIAHDFYKHFMNRGYVVANKEPNTKGCGGDCIEYGFLKLDPAFGKSNI